MCELDEMGETWSKADATCMKLLLVVTPVYLACERLPSAITRCARREKDVLVYALEGLKGLDLSGTSSALILPT